LCEKYISKKKLCNIAEAIPIIQSKIAQVLVAKHHINQEDSVRIASALVISIGDIINTISTGSISENMNVI